MWNGSSLYWLLLICNNLGVGCRRRLVIAVVLMFLPIHKMIPRIVGLIWLIMWNTNICVCVVEWCDWINWWCPASDAHVIKVKGMLLLLLFEPCYTHDWFTMIHIKWNWYRYDIHKNALRSRVGCNVSDILRNFSIQNLCLQHNK